MFEVEDSGEEPFAVLNRVYGLGLIMWVYETPGHLVWFEELRLKIRWCIELSLPPDPHTSCPNAGNCIWFFDGDFDFRNVVCHRHSLADCIC